MVDGPGERAMGEAAAVFAARMIGLDLPDECRPGVAANLALLAEHRARIAASGVFADDDAGAAAGAGACSGGEEGA